MISAIINYPTSVPRILLVSSLSTLDATTMSQTVPAVLDDISDTLVVSSSHTQELMNWNKTEYEQM